MNELAKLDYFEKGENVKHVLGWVSKFNSDQQLDYVLAILNSNMLPRPQLPEHQHEMQRHTHVQDLESRSATNK